MTRKLHLLWVFAGLLLFFSCDDEKNDVPVISALSFPESAYMADSIAYSVTVESDRPLNSILVSFYYGETKISETIMPVNEPGTHNGKLFVPFTKDVEDGPGEVRVNAKTKYFDYSTETTTIRLSRPVFPYLTLKTEYGDFRMEPVDGEPYKYAVDHAFPTQELEGIIEAPAYGENGNSFYFGGNPVVGNASDTDYIKFVTDTPVGDVYTVSFNTLSYVFEPFVEPSFDGEEFPAYDEDGLAVIEKDIEQNSVIIFRGFLDIDEWWIDPTFLKDNGDGTYIFLAVDGKYRITADRNLKYFKIEPMDGDELADFDPATKTGGIWVNGGIAGLSGTAAPANRLGIPSMETNPTNWDPAKNFAMAEVGNGIYQVRLISNQTMFMSNFSANTVGISFYQNSRSKENALPLTIVKNLYGSPPQPDPGSGSERFGFSAGNDDSNGNMIVSMSNRTLGNGLTYVFTLDTNHSPVQVSISVD